MRHRTKISIVAFIIAMVPLTALSEPGITVEQSAVTNIKVIYLEPDQEMGGEPLTDLSHTKISLVDAGVEIDSREVPALEATGGKRIEEDLTVTSQRGSKKNVDVVVTAFDLVGNESDPIAVVVHVDRMPPGQVQKAP